MRYRLGADIGGTFTDLVLEGEGGRWSTKVLTTYDAPEDAIVEGMHQVCAKAGIKPNQPNTPNTNLFLIQKTKLYQPSLNFINKITTFSTR